MRQGRLMLGVLAATVGLQGCASSSQHYSAYQDRTGDLEACQAVSSAYQAQNRTLLEQAMSDALNRGLSGERCRQLLTEGSNTTNNVLLGLTALAAIALAARGGGSAAAPSSLDYEWDWDLFYNESRTLVWACRGVQTGEFADAWRCTSKLKQDRRWPSLSAP